MNTTPNGMPSPRPTFASLNSTSIMSNGPSSSPSAMTTNSSAMISRPAQQIMNQPEQIIVPVGNMMNNTKSSDSSSVLRQSPSAGGSQSSGSTVQGSSSAETKGVLDRMRLRELVKDVDPLEQMDDDVEDVLLQVADDFIENVVAASCQLAKHRRSNTLEAKDVQLYLEKCWNMQIPGFGGEDVRPYKKSAATEAHKQRMALIRKTLKKY